MWRVIAVAELLAAVVVLLVVALLVPSHPWWMWAAYAVLLVPLAVAAAVVPTVRNRVHRWEVTPGAVYTRSGWITTRQRIAPLSRVQTVDSRRGAVMRLFGLTTVTVTTASAAGAITIDGLDDEVARRVVAELTEITAASEGDAT
ncbi:PH domain-containing protein [Nocardioides jensenii]|uniref:PH domain-containing protein n=1 Tax=Nocardioides jensenii TaxID=1843 RepID=UPI0009E8A473|nr:PH domain-containing protein [Nocardioides jensenii]